MAATAKLIAVQFLECNSQESDARHSNYSDNGTDDGAVRVSEYHKHPTNDHSHIDESSSSPERNCRNTQLVVENKMVPM
jgi:hypothetical protein